MLKDHLKTAKRSLDVGSGSGYLTLAFAQLMEDPEAVSYGIEHISTLVKESIVNLKKYFIFILNIHSYLDFYFKIARNH